MTQETGTILLVEDDDGLRNLFANMLQKLGYEVLVAENGVHALEICERARAIDLLLTDIAMPQMGGFELARRVQKLNPQLQVLYMSGYASDALDEDERRVPENCFIQKPFDKQTLATKISELRTSRAPAK